MKKRRFRFLVSFMAMLVMMLAMTVTSFAETAPTPQKKQVEIVKAKASGKQAVKLTWKKVDGAKQYTVYGQLDGKKYKKIATVKKSKTSYTVKKIAGKALKSGKVYKFYVAAKTAKGNVKSKEIKFITGNKMGKYANVKTFKVNKKAVTLEVGKTETLKVTKKMYNNKKHLPKKYGTATRYISDTPAVAKVSSKGVITAVAEGTATIYVQDLGGLYSSVKVTVKSAESPTPTPTSEPTATPTPTSAPTATPTPTADPTPAPSGDVYTVKFNMNGHGTAIKPQKVEKGKFVTEPETPAEAGYRFDGWYKDKDCTDGEEWYFDFDEVTSDTVLYAKWTEVYTVTFDLNGRDGEAPAPQMFDVTAKNPKATKPKDPEVDGYIFKGWYSDEACTDGKEWDFSTVITADTTIYAKWQKDKTFKAILGTQYSKKYLYFAYNDVEYTVGQQAAFGADHPIVDKVYEGKGLFDDTKEGKEKWGYNTDRSSIYGLHFDDSLQNYELKSAAYMFADMISVNKVAKFNNFKTSTIKDIRYMFSNFASSVPDTTFVKVDMSEVSFDGVDTTNAANYENVFSGIKNNCFIVAPKAVLGGVTNSYDKFYVGSDGTYISKAEDVYGFFTVNAAMYEEMLGKINPALGTENETKWTGTNPGTKCYVATDKYTDNNQKFIKFCSTVMFCRTGSLLPFDQGYIALYADDMAVFRTDGTGYITEIEVMYSRTTEVMGKYTYKE